MEKQVERLQRGRDLSDERTARLVGEIERLRTTMASLTKKNRRLGRTIHSLQKELTNKDVQCGALRSALTLANCCVVEKDRLLFQLTQPYITHNPKGGVS